MLLVQITSQSEEEAGKISVELADRISAWQAQPTDAFKNGRFGKIRMNGPADATVRKVNDVYRRVIYIKSENYAALVDIKDMLEEYVRETVTSARTYVWYDFDPMNGF